jgi:hypothetical protein
MPSRRYLLAALLALPLVIAGCKINTINYFPVKYANVRMINLMPDVPALNVTQGSTTVWSGVAFEGSTGYLDFENTTNTFTVSVAGATSSLISVTYDLAGEAPYTLIPYGTLDAPQVLMLLDTAVTPGDGRFQMRAVNVAPGNPSIDIYVTTPGVPIDNLAANFYQLGYGGVTAYGGFATGTYQVRATLTGTKTVVYDSGPRTYGSNATTAFIFYTRGSGDLYNGIQADVYGSVAVANSTQARLKAVNGAIDAGPVNQLVDGTALASNVAYAAASSYGTTAAGARTIAFEATATPGAIIASVAKTLTPATDASVFVTGFAGAQQAIVLADTNLPPTSGNVRIRFVNASPNTAAMDVLVNGTKKVSALASTTASSYVELVAGTYTLTFADPTTGAVLLSLTNREFTADHVSSVYVVGGAGSLTGLVTQDD